MMSIDPVRAEAELQDAVARECGLPPDAVVALTIWGEARGEKNVGMAAVASVILRRALRRMAASGDPLDAALSRVCLAKFQFSCWKDGKFNQTEPHDCPEWDECDRLARSLLDGSFEPTIVATSYYADYMSPPPYWAAKMDFVDKIGHHLFYREW